MRRAINNNATGLVYRKRNNSFIKIIKIKMEQLFCRVITNRYLIRIWFVAEANKRMVERDLKLIRHSSRIRKAREEFKLVRSINGF